MQHTTNGAGGDVAGRFNPAAMASLPATRDQGAVIARFTPSDFGQLMEFARLMAQSGKTVPKHLRGQPGACLAVAMVAYNLGMNPFLLALDTYEVNDVVAYGAKAIAAMVDNSGLLSRPLMLAWEGAGEDLKCTCTGYLKGDPEPRALTVEMRTIAVRNSPLWKQQPRIQLGYYTKRAWARLYMPGVLLGLPADDELFTEPPMQTINPDPASEPRPTRSSVRRETSQRAQVVDVEPAPVDAAPTAPAPVEPATADVAKADHPTFAVINAEGEIVAEGLAGQDALKRVALLLVDAIDSADVKAAVAICEANADLINSREAIGGECVKRLDILINDVADLQDEAARSTTAFGDVPAASPAADDTGPLFSPPPTAAPVPADGDDLLIQVPLGEGGSPNWQQWLKAMRERLNAMKAAGATAADLARFRARTAPAIGNLGKVNPSWAKALTRDIEQAMANAAA